MSKEQIDKIKKNRLPDASITKINMNSGLMMLYNETTI